MPKSRARVIGPCERLSPAPIARRCDDVWWGGGYALCSQGPTGPTGPTGPNAFNERGSFAASQSMLDSSNDESTTFASAFTSFPLVVFSITSTDPYFMERYISSAITSVSNTGFTVTTKMVYGARTIIDDEIDPDINVQGSIALPGDGKPMIAYVKSDDTINTARVLTQNGDGPWQLYPTLPYVAGSVISRLLIAGNGTPGLFIHIQGNFTVRYYGSISVQGLPGAWTGTDVYVPVGSEQIFGMSGEILSSGTPAVVYKISDPPNNVIQIGVSSDLGGTGWTLIDVLTGVDINTFPIQLLLQSNAMPGIVYTTGTSLMYISSTSYTGANGTWTITSTISNSSSIDIYSVRACVLSNGLPAVFFKVTNNPGVYMSVCSAANGGGSWNLQSLLFGLNYIATSKGTLFPFTLPNGNIGLMYTSAEGLEFAWASLDDLSVWTSNLVDTILPGTGYQPHAVILDDGYLGYSYVAYGDTATVIYGRSAIMNGMRMLDSTSYTIIWGASPS